MDLKIIVHKLCQKFQFGRFEKEKKVRSFTKLIEAEVNLSKYHLFLTVAENNIEEVKMYHDENAGQGTAWIYRPYLLII
jgi:hypothetical protein